MACCHATRRLSTCIRSNHSAGAAHPKRVKVADAPVPEVDDSAGPVAAQVHRDDELVTLQHCGAGLAPPLQPHLGRPPPHIVVHILLVIPSSHIVVGAPDCQNWTSNSKVYVTRPRGQHVLDE